MSKQEVGRLAMRVEGNFWVAYYAEPGSMAGAIDLGRIRMVGVATPERKAVFLRLMRDLVSDIIEHHTGARPVWPEPDGHPAPEHERSGHA